MENMTMNGMGTDAKCPGSLRADGAAETKPESALQTGKCSSDTPVTDHKTQLRLRVEERLGEFQESLAGIEDRVSDS